MPPAVASLVVECRSRQLLQLKPAVAVAATQRCSKVLSWSMSQQSGRATTDRDTLQTYRYVGAYIYIPSGPGRAGRDRGVLSRQQIDRRRPNERRRGGRYGRAQRNTRHAEMYCTALLLLLSRNRRLRFVSARVGA